MSQAKRHSVNQARSLADDQDKRLTEDRVKMLTEDQVKRFFVSRAKKTTVGQDKRPGVSQTIRVRSRCSLWARPCGSGRSRDSLWDSHVGQVRRFSMHAGFTAQLRFICKTERREEFLNSLSTYTIHTSPSHPPFQRMFSSIPHSSFVTHRHVR